MQFCSEAAQELKKVTGRVVIVGVGGERRTPTSHDLGGSLLAQMNSYSFHFFKAAHSKVSDDDDMSGLKRLLRSLTLWQES